MLPSLTSGMTKKMVIGSPPLLLTPSVLKPPVAVNGNGWSSSSKSESLFNLLTSTRPFKANPDYKGKWYAPKIDNPAYKGVWAPRKIPNPNYFEDLTPVKTLSKIVSV
jgi:hypothetical protein